MQNKTFEKWEEKTLEDLCEIEIGKTPNRSTPKFWDKELITDNTWLSIADLNNTLNKAVFTSKERISDIGASNIKIVKQGTLLLSFKLTIGRVAFAGKNLYTNEAIAQLPIKNPKEIDKNYLYYYLQYFNYDKLLRGDVKVKGKALNKEKLKALPVLYPELSEQRRIVKILNEAFENIEKAKQNALQNLNKAKELFETTRHELFAKNTNNWQVKKMPEIATNLDSKRIPITKNMRISGDIPYYGASGVVDYVKDYIFEDTLLLISEDGANLLMRTYPIAFSTSGKAWVNNHAHVLKFNDLITQKFVEYYLNSINLEQYITGAAQPKLNQTALNSIPIIYPPLTEQQKIVAQLDELQEQTKKLEQIYEQKIKDLDELKQSILQKAFNGEL